jgi:hypothetical protein
MMLARMIRMKGIKLYMTANTYFEDFEDSNNQKDSSEKLIQSFFTVLQTSIHLLSSFTV